MKLYLIFFYFINFTNQIKLRQEYYNFLIKKNIIINYYKLSNQNNYDFYCKKKIKNYKIFCKNFININKYNNLYKDNFEMELNKFSDNILISKNNLPNDLNNMKINFKFINKNVKYNNLNSLFKKNDYTNFIWDDKYISEVKDQGKCGSCWAFSSTCAIESLIKINNNQINRLSEQELIDCSNNYGCYGGLMHKAFDYIIDNGLYENNYYKYQAINNNFCKSNFNLTKNNLTKIKKYIFTLPRSINSIKNTLMINPICIGLDANNYYFRFYKSGILDVNLSKIENINHAVLLVGFSQDENFKKYWIIKNSWGKEWGMNGYAKIAIKEKHGVLSCQLYGVIPSY